jgi:hypothetical protein
VLSNAAELVECRGIAVVECNAVQFVERNGFESAGSDGIAFVARNCRTREL